MGGRSEHFNWIFEIEFKIQNIFGGPTTTTGVEMYVGIVRVSGFGDRCYALQSGFAVAFVGDVVVVVGVGAAHLLSSKSNYGAETHCH